MDKIRNKDYSILVVDDEPLIRESLYEILRIDGFRAHMAQSGEEALEILKGQEFDIIVMDMKLPKLSGLEMIEGVKKDYPETEVIMVTGYGSIESAVEAMKKGAFDYITKPINDQEIKMVINKIVEKKEIIKENRELKKQIAKSHPSSFCSMIGASDSMQRVYHIIESVATSNATILITGESGTGKGLVARAIHKTDQNRKDEPFIEVSCGALSETLLESELFGHAKGAFTGAIKDKYGRFEVANGGTIFLDEIDAFSPNLQVKLLRVLQDGVFERVGENVTKRADVRIIVATNRDLVDSVEEEKFREDLYYRINVINLHIPPLRDRKEDVPMLINHFIEQYCRVNNKEIKNISDEVKKTFFNYNWPGNIRELENAIEGAVVMSKSEVINKWDVPNFKRFAQTLVLKTTNGKSLKKVMEQPEKETILSVLEECNWNRNKAAAALGINRTTLYNKMKKFDIFFDRS